jgi:hypothetical protein
MERLLSILLVSLHPLHIALQEGSLGLIPLLSILLVSLSICVSGYTTAGDLIAKDGLLIQPPGVTDKKAGVGNMLQMVLARPPGASTP